MKSCCQITSFSRTNLKSTLLREVSCSCSGSPEEGGFKLGNFSIGKKKTQTQTGKTQPNPTQPKQKPPSHIRQVMLCCDDRPKGGKKPQTRTTPFCKLLLKF